RAAGRGAARPLGRRRRRGPPHVRGGRRLAPLRRRTRQARGLAAVTVTGRRSKSRRSAPRPATFGPPNSVTQEQRDGAVFEEALRRRAEEQLLQPRGGVGAGDDEVGVGLGGVAEDALAHGAVLDARRPDAAVAV